MQKQTKIIPCPSHAYLIWIRVKENCNTTEHVGNFNTLAEMRADEQMSKGIQKFGTWGCDLTREKCQVIAA